MARLLAGCWRPAHGSGVGDGALASLVPLLIQGGVGALAWRQLRDRQDRQDRQDATADRLRDTHRFQALQAALAERDLATLVALLQSRAIEPLLIKGWAVARLYPEPGLRPYGDIDLCLRPHQVERAQALVQREYRGRTRVDLHAGAPRYFDHDIETLFSSARRLRLEGVSIRVPSPEQHLRLLCLHFLGHGAWRAVWLVDIALLMEHHAADFSWPRVLEGHSRQSDWTECTLQLAAQLLEARHDGFARQRKRRPPRWLADTVLREWGQGSGLSQRAPVGVPREPKGLKPLDLVRNLCAHWRNPILATVETGGPFNGLPRFPFQLGAAILRLPVFLRRLRRSASGPRSWS